MAMVFLLLGGDRLIGVGAGTVFALLGVCESAWRSRRRFNRRHPHLADRWRAVPRRTRRRIREAVRHGTPVPREYAPAVIEDIDLLLKLQRAEKITRRRNLFQSTAVVLVNIVAAALVLHLEDRSRVELALGFAFASCGVTLAILTAAVLIWNKRWDRLWPARLALARTEAERVLHGPQAGPDSSLPP